MHISKIFRKRNSNEENKKNEKYWGKVSYHHSFSWKDKGDNMIIYVNYGTKDRKFTSKIKIYSSYSRKYYDGNCTIRKMNKRAVEYTCVEILDERPSCYFDVVNLLDEEKIKQIADFLGISVRSMTGLKSDNIHWIRIQ